MGRERIRRLSAWLENDAPLVPGLDRATWFVNWLGCRLHGHVPFDEMDGRSVVCASCHRLLYTKPDPVPPEIRERLAKGETLIGRVGPLVYEWEGGRVLYISTYASHRIPPVSSASSGGLSDRPERQRLIVPVPLGFPGTPEALERFIRDWIEDDTDPEDLAYMAEGVFPRASFKPRRCICSPLQHVPECPVHDSKPR